MISRAAKIAIAYDYKTRCATTDACTIANVYFAQKFIDLGVDCADNTILQNHVNCFSFPDITSNPVTHTSCNVTITEADPTECRVVTITVIQ